MEVKAKKVLDGDPVDDVNDTSEIYELNEGKRRLKHPGSVSKTVKVTNKKKLSVKSDDGSGCAVVYAKL